MRSYIEWPKLDGEKALECFCGAYGMLKVNAEFGGGGNWNEMCRKSKNMRGKEGDGG